MDKGLSEVQGNSEVMAEVGGFSGEGWRSAADVRAFVELLSRILFGDSVEESGSSLSGPAFILTLVERGRSLDSNAKLLFVDIFETLKNSDVRILEGVDSTEVSNSASWIEFSEALT
jgi:hypothetical protein